MKKVFQTIVDPEHGNCEQAVIASLLELPLEEVPNFIEQRKSGEFHQTLIGWLYSKGYSPTTVGKDRHGSEKLKEIAKFDGGFNGYFYASVISQTFENIYHAVIVDIDLNIVHDPNPNQNALNLTPDDVLFLIVTKNMIIGKTGKLFTREEWDSTTEEERDANTYKTIYNEDNKIIGSE